MNQGTPLAPDPMQDYYRYSESPQNDIGKGPRSESYAAQRAGESVKKISELIADKDTASFTNIKTELQKATPELTGTDTELLGLINELRDIAQGMNAQKLDSGYVRLATICRTYIANHRSSLQKVGRTLIEMLKKPIDSTKDNGLIDEGKIIYSILTPYLTPKQ